MEISSKAVADLRAETGVGMMDCKKALVEAGGDFEEARKILRKRGLASAARKADRATSEGLVIARVLPGAAALVEVNGKAIEIASQLRIELLAAVRTEKNAVISPEDKESMDFANQSREHTARVNKLRAELSRLVSADPASPERQELDEFTRAWEKYQDSQKEVLRLAVKGMMPRNRLARKQLTKLKVYAGPEHPHAAQQPQPMEISQ